MSEMVKCAHCSKFGWKVPPKKGQTCVFCNKMAVSASNVRRPTSMKPMPEVFQEWHDVTIEETVEVFDQSTDTTPSVDPYYVIPEIQAQEAIAILSKQERNNLWLMGWSGSGKSSLIRQLAGRFNADFHEVNGHEHMVPGNLFGKWTVRAGETVFQDGVVTRWMENGGWLLINEFSTMDPSVVNALKSCLEHPRTLTLTEHDGRVIKGHPDCRFIASDNTKGRGDDSGQFINTQVQSSADMRRFNGFVVLDFIEKDQEIAALTRRFPPESTPAGGSMLPAAAIEKMVTVANQTRDGFKKGTLGRVLSVAEVINWAENYRLFSTAHRSASVSFLNSYEPEAATAVRELINTAFGREDSETLVNADAAKRSADKTGV